MYKKCFKRFLDVICALCVFIFLWPLYLLLVILVRCKLGKPVLFKQLRPGKDGKIFTLYKFRTMNDKQDEDGNLLPDDQRLTSFGKKLRNSSLDEMPEAINILKGDMSVIGPRPLIVKDYVFFSSEVMKRQSIRPGLSGLAQINGRNNLSWEDKFKYDLEYIQKESFGLDFKLVFKTIGKAFVKHDDIVRDGFVTDEDYGDYLLRYNLVSKDEYVEKVSEARKIVASYKKK